MINAPHKLIFALVWVVAAHVHVPPALYRIDAKSGQATFIAQTDLQIGALVEVDRNLYRFEGVLDGFNFTYTFPSRTPSW